jgi:hypothetical protein
VRRLSDAQWLALNRLASGTGYHLRWWEGRRYAVHAPSGVRVFPDRFGQATVDRLVTLGLLEADHLPDGTLTLSPTALAWSLAHEGKLR